MIPAGAAWPDAVGANEPEAGRAVAGWMAAAEAVAEPGAAAAELLCAVDGAPTPAGAGAAAGTAGLLDAEGGG